MPLPNNATVAQIIASLQESEGINQKADMVSALGAPWTNADTMAAIISGLQTDKNNLAAAIVGKGGTAVGTESMDSLVSKVAGLTTVKRWATGTTTYASGIAANGLGFRPRFIIAYVTNPNATYQASTVVLIVPSEMNFYNGGVPNFMTGYQPYMNSSNNPAATSVFGGGQTITNDGFSSVGMTAQNGMAVRWYAFE